MKKGILLFGFLLSTAFVNANDVKKCSDEDIIAKREAIAYNIQKFKTEILLLRIKQSKNINQAVRLLNEMKNNISKMEK